MTAHPYRVTKGKAKAITLAPITMKTVEPPPPAPEPKTKSARRNAKKTAAAKVEGPKLATPPTIRDRTHHDDAHGIDKSAYVQTTNGVPKLLRRIKARTGSHVEQFQKDYEMAGSDLRSASLEGAGGGSSGSMPFPVAKVMAIERLTKFQNQNIVAFLMCEAVLMGGETPASIHAKGGPQHVVCSHMIRESIEALAKFYTPNRKRPDKMLAVLSKIVEDARRRLDSSRS